VTGVYLFIYHDNHNQDWIDPKHPGKVIHSTIAASIVDADIDFSAHTGISVQELEKSTWIGREIKEAS
jgi:hypothetical protein